MLYPNVLGKGRVRYHPRPDRGLGGLQKPKFRLNWMKWPDRDPGAAVLLDLDGQLLVVDAKGQ